MKLVKYGSVLLLAVLAAPGVSNAQSSVTLYGSVDGGVTYSSNQGGNSAYQAQDGKTYPNRWGLTGAEDLGGGLKAIFKLEAGFGLNNGMMGQGSREFGRGAYVGLSSATLGTLTLGRQFDLIGDLIYPVAASNNFTPYFSHPGDIDNLNSGFLIDRAVKYVSPSWGGFSIGALYSFGGVPGDFSRNGAVGASLTYKSGPVFFGAGYLHLDHPLTSATEGYWNEGAPTASYNPSYSYVESTFANNNTNNKYQTYVIGGTYTIGTVTIGGNYTNTQFSDALAGKTARFQNAEVNASYYLTPAVRLGAAYTYTWGNIAATNTTPQYHQVNAIATYFLSKATNVYTLAAYQRAGGDAQFAQIVGLGASSRKNQTLVRLGMAHSF